MTHRTKTSAIPGFWPREGPVGASFLTFVKGQKDPSHTSCTQSPLHAPLGHLAKETISLHIKNKRTREEVKVKATQNSVSHLSLPLASWVHNSGPLIHLFNGEHRGVCQCQQNRTLLHTRSLLILKSTLRKLQLSLFTN